MFPKPRRLESESALYDDALRALMRRAYSVHEMKQHLARRSDNGELIKLVIDLLKREGHLDDARFAKQFARQRTEIRRQGPFRIARDLRARGVPDQHIQAALAANAQDHDEAALVRQRLDRKLRSLRGELDDRKLASLYRSLLRSGFSADIVRREVKALTRHDLPDPGPASEE